MNFRTTTFVILGTVLAISSLGQSFNITSSKSSGEKFTYRNSHFISDFNVEVRGKIELSDDDKDVKGMSPDGYLEITKTVFGNKRSIVITPQGSGLKREYYESRTPVAFEPEGRKWLSEILPELVRNTTIGAESRVNRYYRLAGSKGVLDEISRLESDYVKAHYANLLMDLNVPIKDYGVIVNQVASTIDSDHYLTEFLKKGISKFLGSKEATEAVFAATRKMDSDHYKTEVIKEGLRSGPASLESVKIILEATGNMDSDHYKTEVFSTLLKQNNLTDAIIAEMVNSTKSIGSDYYRTVVLNKALDKEGLSSTSYQKVIESVKDIDSDHYKTEVLTHLLQNSLSPEAINNLITIASSIGSDHYLTLVGNEIMKKQNLTDEGFQKLLDTMGHQDSDYYSSTFLQSALQRPNLTKQNLTAILQSAGNIGSDHYITEVLVDIAPKIKASNDTSLKDAYRAAAKKIESETYYGRALKAIE